MRIIAGTARGRVLRAPPGSDTRPTSDRVRESAFSMLAARGVLHGAQVLDLFAGSGALALEALSRGAATATLVDASPECATVIDRNAQTLGFAEQCTVLQMSVSAALTRLTGQGARFDLALLGW